MEGELPDIERQMIDDCIRDLADLGINVELPDSTTANVMLSGKEPRVKEFLINVVYSCANEQAINRVRGVMKRNDGVIPQGPARNSLPIISEIDRLLARTETETNVYVTGRNGQEKMPRLFCRKKGENGSVAVEITGGGESTDVYNSIDTFVALQRGIKFYKETPIKLQP